MQHLRYTGHDLIRAQQRGAEMHQVRDAAAVARAFDNCVGDQRDGLRIVELHAPLEAPFRHHGGGRQRQLVFLSRRQFHITPP